MNEFFDDPKFPSRPSHADMARLIGAINRLDGRTNEGGEDSLDVAAEFVDPASLIYMAHQRALRMSMLTGLPTDMLTALWIDAFVAGCQYERDGGHTPS